MARLRLGSAVEVLEVTGRPRGDQARAQDQRRLHPYRASAADVRKAAEAAVQLVEDARSASPPSG